MAALFNAPFNQAIQPDAPLRLVLFIDKRPNSGEQIRQVRQYLKDLQDQYEFVLEIINVGEQPHLAEYFKLIATPALIKVYPPPQRTLAGSDLIAQLKTWWPRWQRSVEDYLAAKKLNGGAANGDGYGIPEDAAMGSIAYSSELIKLSDEVFRLKQEQEALQARLQFKDRIISMLAHDLRNPLTAASIAIETLELGYAENDARKARLTPQLTAQLLKHAKTQIRAIDRMITDILQTAQGTSTELQIQPRELELEPLSASVIDSLNNRFEAKDHHVTTDIPNDLPKVYADSTRVQQVMVNLLDNAIKYTPTGGSIQISALHRTTQKVQVSICDTGPGIPEENQSKIFENSFRLKRDQGTDGYGIGLSLCQRIIAAHYGQIWVDSVPGKGSCFHFTLPVFRY